jgi:hypothetical protein
MVVSGTYVRYRGQGRRSPLKGSTDGAAPHPSADGPSPQRDARGLQGQPCDFELLHCNSVRLASYFRAKEYGCSRRGRACQSRHQFGRSPSTKSISRRDAPTLTGAMRRPR